MKIDLSLDLGSETTKAEEWVKQNRITQSDREKKLSELQAKHLRDDEDEENQVAQYGSSSLKGLKITHSLNDFESGKEIILTLSDANVVEKDIYGRVIGIKEDDDVLENVNLMDDERKQDRDKRLKRSRQPVYAGYDDAEFEAGPGIKPSILQQYDSEKRKGPRMIIGDTISELKENNEATEQANPRQFIFQTLQTESKLANAALLPEEIKIRKSSNGESRKKKKIRERKQEAEDEDYDLSNILGNEEVTINKDEFEMEVVKNELNETTPAMLPKASIKPVSIVRKAYNYDDEDEEFAKSLAKARQLALKKRETESNPEEDAEADDAGALRAIEISKQHIHDQGIVESKNDDDEEINVEGRRSDGKLIFNSTTEFATRLQAHLIDRARTKTEEAAKNFDGALFEDIAKEDHDDGMEFEMEEGEEAEKSDEEEDDDVDFLLNQPTASRSMADALKLLQSTGDLKPKQELYGRAKDSRNLDQSKPDHDFKLEYRDDKGRKLTQKEAFRQLSYKFHGQGPSQKTKEKRKKAYEAQNKVNLKSNLLEGTAGTMRSLTATQEATGKAHLVVQAGGGVASLLSAISGKKK